MDKRSANSEASANKKRLQLGSNAGGQGRITGDKPLPVCGPSCNPSPLWETDLLVYYLYLIFFLQNMLSRGSIKGYFCSCIQKEDLTDHK